MFQLCSATSILANLKQILTHFNLIESNVCYKHCAVPLKSSLLFISTVFWFERQNQRVTMLFWVLLFTFFNILCYLTTSKHRHLMLRSWGVTRIKNCKYRKEQRKKYIQKSLVFGPWSAFLKYFSHAN